MQKWLQLDHNTDKSFCENIEKHNEVLISQWLYSFTKIGYFAKYLNHAKLTNTATNLMKY